MCYFCELFKKGRGQIVQKLPDRLQNWVDMIINIDVNIDLGTGGQSRPHLRFFARNMVNKTGGRMPPRCFLPFNCTL